MDDSRPPRSDDLATRTTTASGREASRGQPFRGVTPSTRRGPLARRLQQWQQNRADLKLFRHLATRRRLPEDDQLLLAALADEHQLVRLSEIFLRPSLFRASPDPRRWGASEVHDLRRRVFAEPSLPEVQPTTPTEGEPGGGATAG